MTTQSHITRIELEHAENPEHENNFRFVYYHSYLYEKSYGEWKWFSSWNTAVLALEEAQKHYNIQPKINPAPNGNTNVEVINSGSGYRVASFWTSNPTYIDWFGPMKPTKKEAIEAWNKRNKNHE